MFLKEEFRIPRARLINDRNLYHFFNNATVKARVEILQSG